MIVSTNRWSVVCKASRILAATEYRRETVTEPPVARRAGVAAPLGDIMNF
jgi:hypothetical protein